MKVSFSQIYIEPGVDFPFSWQFQVFLSGAFSECTTPSDQFKSAYGADFNLIINVSAKKAIPSNEVRGPTVVRKSRTIEYTVFLPYDVICKESAPWRSALSFLIQGACEVLASFGIETSTIRNRQESLIDRVCSDPTMFE